jgi:tRNA(Ile)-lysidine synthase
MTASLPPIPRVIPFTLEHTLVQTVSAYCEQHGLLANTKQIIVGFSGGADSLALLALLKTMQPLYGYTLIAAHLDHGWRTRSAVEAAWCHDVAARWRIEFQQAQLADLLPLLSDEQRRIRSAEAQARFARRAFFKSLLTSHYDRIALGHHLDDQVETILLRIVRGTSMSGLGGMKPLQDGFIRPLLGIHKQSLCEALATENVSWLEDPSNTDPSYLRNALRTQALPALRACDERFEHSLLKLGQLAQEEYALLEQLVHKQLLTMLDPTHTMLNITLFATQASTMQRHLLTSWFALNNIRYQPSTALLDELIRFITQSKQGAHRIGCHAVLIKKGTWVELTQTGLY